MIGIIALASVALGSELNAAPTNPPELGLVPRPKTLIEQEGTFTVDQNTVIVANGKLSKVADQLRGYLSPSTGLSLPAGKEAGKNSITLSIDPSLKHLGKEGYRLAVTSDGIRIVSTDTPGAFYGVQTLRQLMPTWTFGKSLSKEALKVPCVWIEDVPRFGWRGAHLDVGRHIMPVEWIKKYLDTLALHKMNSFHWHLTEDQGWRIEIKKYPKLTSVGAWRKETMLGHYNDQKWDGKPYGGFYTQEEVKEIVKYAAERHINVVPEIEMPGHAQAAIAAYPELGNTGKQVGVATKWGVIEEVFNVEDSTIKFLQDVLIEVMALFPSKFIHIGGDECPKTQWKQSEKAQTKMRALGLHDEEELQSWFIKQMDTFLEKKGRRLIGWDEILEGGLAPGATVMSWRGEAGGIKAAEEGHDVVMASTNAFYFDFYQGPKEKEPLAIGGYLPLRKVYDYDIIPAKLAAEKQHHILGGQYQIWTEYIATPEKAEYMAFPRACAAAEILWSPKAGKDFSNFVQRLGVHVGRFDALGVNYRKLDPETTGAASVVAKWSPKDVSNDYQVKTWDITGAIKGPGTYEIRFQYTGGAYRLDIDGIEILFNGEMVEKDSHYGRTGSANVDNVWTVTLNRVDPGIKATLRAKVRADGGSDSNGEISIMKVS